jgi:hypothetical protein
MAIVTKNNNTVGAAPTPSSLVVGELAVNTADGALYTKHTDGEIVLIAKRGDTGASVGALINKPVITSPANGTANYSGSVTSTYSTSVTYQGVQDYAIWQASTDSNFSTIVDSYQGSSNLLTWITSVSTPLTNVYVRVKHGSDSHISDWSDTVMYTTPDVYIQTPTLTVPGSPSSVITNPTLSLSAFAVANGTDTHVSTDWQILQGSTVVWESLSNTTNKSSISVPNGYLEINTSYKFRARHNGTTYGASAWAEVNATTVNIYINVPTLTVQGSPSDVPENPVLTGSTFSVSGGTTTHASTDWEIRLSSNSTLVWSSLANTTNKTSIVVPEGLLLESTSYVFKVRYNGAAYGSSAWAEVTATTTSQFFDPLTDDPAPLGTMWEGGYYAGKMQQDDGIYALIVAPKGLGDNNGATLTWHIISSDTTGAASTYNGFANTQDMISYTNGGIKTWIQNVNSTGINGKNDWYVPSFFELQLLYTKLKPATDINNTSSNSTGAGCTSLVNGTNPRSVPTSPANTSSVPAQTTITDFKTGGSQAFVASVYWSSTEACINSSSAWRLYFGDGTVNYASKSYNYSVRAVRRVKLS